MPLVIEPLDVPAPSERIVPEVIRPVQDGIAPNLGFVHLDHPHHQLSNFRNLTNFPVFGSLISIFCTSFVTLPIFQALGSSVSLFFTNFPVFGASISVLCTNFSNLTDLHRVVDMFHVPILHCSLQIRVLAISFPGLSPLLALLLATISTEACNHHCLLTDPIQRLLSDRSPRTLVLIQGVFVTILRLVFGVVELLNPSPSSPSSSNRDSSVDETSRFFA